MKLTVGRTQLLAAFALAAFTTAAFSVGVSEAAVAPTTAASAAHPVPYPYPDATSTTSSTPGVLAPAASAAACAPYVDGDNVHVSSGDVSGHGWWYQGTCANTKTTVTIYLYEYYSDGTWHYEGTGTKYVYPGGGSANRAAVRTVCTNVVPAGWRTLVVVKIGIGASAYTKTLNLPCRNG
jgi:hypothetical protein